MYVLVDLRSCKIMVNKRIIETDFALAAFVVRNMFCNTFEAIVIAALPGLTSVSLTTAVHHKIIYTRLVFSSFSPAY